MVIDCADLAGVHVYQSVAGSTVLDGVKLPFELGLLARLTDGYGIWRS